MFPFQQSGELSFQISNNPDEQDQQQQQQFIVEEKQILDYCVSENITAREGRGRGRGRGRKSTGEGSTSNLDDGSNHDSGKKIIHRDVERKRRQEMSNLYSSLRSLLPLEYIKGKRSTSDHVGEAVHYIHDLEHNIKELGDRKNKLGKSLITDTTADQNPATAREDSSSNSSSNIVSIYPGQDGLQIEIATGLSEQDGIGALSRILRVLIEEGLNVVSCVSSKANNRSFHNIQTEASGALYVDVPGLQWRLSEAISSGWHEIELP